MVNIVFCFRLSMFTMCPLHTMMQLLSGLLLTICFGFSSGDRVTQEEKSVIGEENKEVSLKCSFETSYSYADLYWYRQYPGSALQYILYNGNNYGKAEFAKKRFDSTVDKSKGTTVLTIKNLIPEDSAVYYCALDATVVYYWKLSYKNLCRCS
ncbi:hypothetical protein GJAV_G00112170 [Gymnothorax javanicus]|nr:hypothetical protein GJAV_G00112170 [Gymnothorax javanicus]